MLRSVVVELRHDTIVRGTLTDADEEMNLIMEGVTYQPLQVRGEAPLTSQAATSCTEEA